MEVFDNFGTSKDDMIYRSHAIITCSCRAATTAKDAKDWSLPSFGSHLNPISTRGADYADPILGSLAG